jgi:hypothetical protein
MPNKVAERHDVDAAIFANEIAGSNTPLLLRGFVRAWPAVRQAVLGPEAVCKYLMGFDSKAEVDALLLAPEQGGRLFYSNDMRGFNFVRSKETISRVIEQLVRYSQFSRAPSVAVQSALIDDCLPGFAKQNQAPGMDGAVRPRIWLGNDFITPAHFDESHNLACVVAGQRRFTLFAPEQVGNLYIGPLDFAPTPTPISLVDFHQPDLTRFPRFAQARAASLVADLGPGDALYIPTLWWHHVQSVGMLNILVNYWWRAPGHNSSPFPSLMACIDSVKDLGPEQRAAWGAFFQHFAFALKDSE